LFATDLVGNGLPIHIGGALLGHLSLQSLRDKRADALRLSRITREVNLGDARDPAARARP